MLTRLCPNWLGDKACLRRVSSSSSSFSTRYTCRCTPSLTPQTLWPPVQHPFLFIQLFAFQLSVQFFKKGKKKTEPGTSVPKPRSADTSLAPVLMGRIREKNVNKSQKGVRDLFAFTFEAGGGVAAFCCRFCVVAFVDGVGSISLFHSSGTLDDNDTRVKHVALIPLSLTPSTRQARAQCGNVMTGSVSVRWLCVFKAQMCCRRGWWKGAVKRVQHRARAKSYITRCACGR